MMASNLVLAENSRSSSLPSLSGSVVGLAIETAHGGMRDGRIGWSETFCVLGGSFSEDIA